MSTAMDVINELKAGNLAYVSRGGFTGDVSAACRERLAKGQSPKAVVIACADSRVVPEIIFSCGLGELFTIRIAGNVIDAHQLGSIEYAVSHLKSPLVLVLGHTHCGAVGAALHGDGDGHIRYITDSVKKAIGKETDPKKACMLNAQAAAEEIRRAFAKETDAILQHEQVAAAIYDIESGEVEWLEDKG